MNIEIRVFTKDSHYRVFEMPLHSNAECGTKHTHSQNCETFPLLKVLLNMDDRLVYQSLYKKKILNPVVKQTFYQ